MNRREVDSTASPEWMPKPSLTIRQAMISDTLPQAIYNLEHSADDGSSLQIFKSIGYSRSPVLESKSIYTAQMGQEQTFFLRLNPNPSVSELHKTGDTRMRQLWSRFFSTRASPSYVSSHSNVASVCHVVPKQSHMCWLGLANCHHRHREGQLRYLAGLLPVGPIDPELKSPSSTVCWRVRICPGAAP